LNIEVPVEDVDRFRGILATYTKVAQIPGFRRGRAPPIWSRTGIPRISAKTSRAV
jgi:FKBP-type peptidyl-prolyl cis-trans isomerase (trigger factor)